MHKAMRLVVTVSAAIIALTVAERGAQAQARDPSVVAITIGYGSATSDWFAGLYESDGLNRYTADLGGFTAALKFLRGINGRLRIGGEVGILTLAAGGSGEYLGQARRSPVRCRDCFGAGVARTSVRPTRPAGGRPSGQIITTYYVPESSDPDDAGIHFNALGSLRLATTGRVTWRVEGGGGFMYWNLNDAGRAADQNYSRKFSTGSAYYDSKPGMEPMLVARLVPTIMWGGRGPTGAAFALDPYVCWVSTTGTTATSFVNFGVGFGMQLGGSR